MRNILNSIIQLDEKIISAKEFLEIKNEMIRILSENISVDYIDLWVLEKKKIYSYDKKYIVPFSKTPAKELINTGSIFYVKDLSKERKFKIEEQFYKEGLLSVVYAPLLFQGKVFAILVIGGKEINSYREKDIEFIKLITSQVSVPLKAFLLKDENERNLEILKSVHKIAKMVNLSITLDKCFKNFVKELRKYVPFDRLSIGIIEGENIRYVEVSEIIKTGRMAGTRLPLEYTASCWVAKNKKTFIRKDLAKKIMFPIEKEKLKQGIRSTIHIPLLHKNEVFGTLNLSSTKPNAYGKWEKIFIETLVSHISGIIALTYLHSPFYDTVTGVYNRKYFDERLDEELRLRERYGGEFSLCLCDLDNFKLCNDFYGHIEGDRILAKISKIMQETIRKSDLIFRYGGDEFAIIMPNTSLKDAIKVGERLRREIEKKMEDKKITVSLGISCYPFDGRTRTEIIDKADRRLLRAKERKNTLCYKD